MQTVKSAPLVRKQIMLSVENLEKLALIANRKKSSVAHIVRNAIDSYEPDVVNEDSELAELIEIATLKLRAIIEDTKETRKHLNETLSKLSHKEI